MTSNHKLTSVLKGRTINSTQNVGGTATIGFTDGSAMTVQTSGSNSSARSGGTVKAVRQQGTTLALDFTDDTTWEIATAEETSSIMVRDKNHALEYAD